MPIFAPLPGIAELREPGQIGVAEFDTYLPLMSLPRLFGTTLQTVPADAPYIDVAALHRRKDDPALVLPAASYPKVGIAWAGSPANRTDRQRSCALTDFLPFLRMPTVAFYSLQKGER